MTITLDDLARMAEADAKAWKAASASRARGRAAEVDECAAKIAADPALQAAALPIDAPKTPPRDVPDWE